LAGQHCTDNWPSGGAPLGVIICECDLVPTNCASVATTPSRPKRSRHTLTWQ